MPLSTEELSENCHYSLAIAILAAVKQQWQPKCVTINAPWSLLKRSGWTANWHRSSFVTRKPMHESRGGERLRGQNTVNC